MSGRRRRQSYQRRRLGAARVVCGLRVVSMRLTSSEGVLAMSCVVLHHILLGIKTANVQYAEPRNATPEPCEARGYCFWLDGRLGEVGPG